MGLDVLLAQKTDDTMIPHFAHFGIKRKSNLTEMEPVIGMEDMVLTYVTHGFACVAQLSWSHRNIGVISLQNPPSHIIMTHYELLNKQENVKKRVRLAWPYYHPGILAWSANI